MTSKQVQENLAIELIHSKPFIPFILELADGQSILIPHPRLAIDDKGAGFDRFGIDLRLVDVGIQETSKRLRLSRIADRLQIKSGNARVATEAEIAADIRDIKVKNWTACE